MPPSPIRVIFDSNEPDFVVVAVSLTVAGEGVSFRLGDKHRPQTPSAAQHSVSCNPDIDTVVYLHEWGAPKVMDEIEVIVELGGVLRSSTAKVIG